MTAIATRKSFSIIKACALFFDERRYVHYMSVHVSAVMAGSSGDRREGLVETTMLALCDDTRWYFFIIYMQAGNACVRPVYV